MLVTVVISWGCCEKQVRWCVGKCNAVLAKGRSTKSLDVSPAVGMRDLIFPFVGRPKLISPWTGCDHCISVCTSRWWPQPSDPPLHPTLQHTVSPDALRAQSETYFPGECCLKHRQEGKGKRISSQITMIKAVCPLAEQKPSEDKASGSWQECASPSSVLLVSQMVLGMQKGCQTFNESYTLSPYSSLYPVLSRGHHCPAPPVCSFPAWPSGLWVHVPTRHNSGSPTGPISTQLRIHHLQGHHHIQ